MTETEEFKRAVLDAAQFSSFHQDEPWCDCEYCKDGRDYETKVFNAIMKVVRAAELPTSQPAKGGENRNTGGSR